MKNWNFSLRDGNDHLNIDFETNSVLRIQEKLNAFFSGSWSTYAFGSLYGRGT